MQKSVGNKGIFWFDKLHDHELMKESTINKDNLREIKNTFYRIYKRKYIFFYGFRNLINV